MPPKVKIVKDDILNAALEIAVESGLKSITAKKVADSLSSSVIPVYSNFKNIEHLKQEVINKAKETAQKLVQKQYTDIQFLNMSIGSLLFSIEHKELYKSILSDEVFFKNNMHLMAVNAMGKDELFSGLTQLDQIKIYRRVRMFTIGLFLSTPKINDTKQIMQMIDELVFMSNDIINGERVRNSLDTIKIIVTQQEKDKIKEVIKKYKDI